MFQSCFRISFLIYFICFLFIGKVLSQTCLYTEEDLIIIRNKMAGIHTELDNTKDELANTRTTLTNTQSKLVYTQDELANTRTALTSKQDELVSTRISLIRKQDELGSTQTALTSSQEELANTQAALTSSQEELATTQTTLTNTQTTLTNTQDELALKRTSYASLTGTLTRTRSQLTTCQKDLSSTRTTLARTQSQLTSSRASLTSTNAQLTSSHNELVRLEGAVGKKADFCSGSMSGESGVFTSPNFPGNYGNSHNCYRYFGGSSGKVVQISFTKFNTEYSSTCSYDRVIIYIGGTHYGTYCGRNTPPTIRSYEQVKVHFVTDRSSVRSGFVLQWTLEKEPTLVFDVTPRKGNFDHVRHMCQQMNGRLLERGLHKNTYWNNVKIAMSKKPGPMWVGISDRNVEGRWQYLNGERTSDAGLTISWDHGEPNNAGNNEHCAMAFKFGSNVRLNDGVCWMWIEHGVCEIPAY